MNVTKESIREVLGEYPQEQRYSLAIMQDMQRRFGYIPREGLESLSNYLGCSLASLYSMATFYKALSLKPKGKHTIKVCDGTACHIKGASNLQDGIYRLLGIQAGDTTEDGLFSLEVVNCLGACAMAPVMLIDGTVYGRITLEKLPGIFDSYRKEDAQ